MRKSLGYESETGSPGTPENASGAKGSVQEGQPQLASKGPVGGGVESPPVCVDCHQVIVGTWAYSAKLEALCQTCAWKRVRAQETPRP